MSQSYNVVSEVWVYPGNTPWHFVTIGKAQSKDIRSGVGQNSRGFGSIPVEVRAGDTVWQTSIFPDSRSGTYLLPLKKDVRKKEGIYEGDRLSITLTLR